MASGKPGNELKVLSGDVEFELKNGEKATFGMQCFWDPEAYFGCNTGVIRVRVGYSGGTKANPTYVNLGDHTETVEAEFDPVETSYSDMLNIFWKHSDPVGDYKTQYESMIFYHTPEQKNLAEERLQEEQKKYPKQPIVTRIVPAARFYNAESSHQKFRLQAVSYVKKYLSLTPNQLIRSHVAARLNGYVCRFGTLDMFNAEKAQLQLSPEVADFFQKLLAR